MPLKVARKKSKKRPGFLESYKKGKVRKKGKKNDPTQSKNGKLHN